MMLTAHQPLKKSEPLDLSLHSTGMKDQDYIEALREGHAEKLTELASDYGERLLKSAYWFCGDASLAEDMVQETFLIAMRSIDRFQGRSSLYTWMYGILRNVWRGALRKKRYHVPLEDAEPFLSVEAESRCHDLPALQEQVATAMQSLSPAHREVVLLRYFEGLSVEDIACQLEITPGTVKSRLFYARESLRLFLPEEMKLFATTAA
jgi:RNA polymerase sigma-70 factor (ECF subfamily)